MMKGRPCTEHHHSIIRWVDEVPDSTNMEIDCNLTLLFHLWAYNRTPLSPVFSVNREGLKVRLIPTQSARQTCKRYLTMFEMESTMLNAYVKKILKCWNHLSIKIFVNKCLNVRWRQFVDMPPFRKWSNMSYMSGLERGEVMRGEVEEWPGIRGWPQLSSGECQESMLECGTSCRVNWGGDTCDTCDTCDLHHTTTNTSTCHTLHTQIRH